ncbi:helix-hairpin-helix domain-containing protein [Shewanella sp. Isolate11]|uniref:helix-hairpin-helix domain-containing protein n=1 Tax=Shewanella sp. Isolate11 TaxID=2908530 RepID=UPI001EFECE69|nr:helix-hairpin-helix domain-containing protein [Shewanella sp. Isolate11]MCG9695763.1 helix-hairpin-helix domain-containing protein [Shewanella sp. Isolate11]
MNPAKVDRSNIKQLTDLPNIGKASSVDLQLLGIHSPKDLVGRDPYQMFDQLCTLTGQKHDPCVIDVFISITRFIKGEEPKSWWAYTPERKKTLATKKCIEGQPSRF